MRHAPLVGTIVTMIISLIITLVASAALNLDQEKAGYIWITVCSAMLAQLVWMRIYEEYLL